MRLSEVLNEHCGCEVADSKLLGPPKKRKKKRALKEGSGDEKMSVNYSSKGMGQFGSMVIVEGGKGLDMLAGILGLDHDWKPKKIGDGWAAYDGARITFFENQRDYSNEDEEDDGGASIEDLHDPEDDSPEGRALRARLKKIGDKEDIKAQNRAKEADERRKKRLAGD